MADEPTGQTPVNWFYVRSFWRGCKAWPGLAIVPQGIVGGLVVGVVLYALTWLFSPKQDRPHNTNAVLFATAAVLVLWLVGTFLWSIIRAPSRLYRSVAEERNVAVKERDDATAALGEAATRASQNPALDSILRHGEHIMAESDSAIEFEGQQTVTASGDHTTSFRMTKTPAQVDPSNAVVIRQPGTQSRAHPSSGSPEQDRLV